MGGLVFAIARALPRRVWVPGAVVAVLLGISGALVAAALVAADHSTSAYARLAEATDGPDAMVAPSDEPDISAEEVVARLGDDDTVVTAVATPLFDVAVSTTGAHPVALGPEPESPCFSGAGDVSAGAVPDGWRGHGEPALLARGRFAEADELAVVLPTITAHRLGLAVGDHLTITGDCAEEIDLRDPIDVRIAGIGTSILDAPAIGSSNVSQELLFMSPAVAEALRHAGVRAQTPILVWTDGHRAYDRSDLPEPWDVAIDFVALGADVHDDLQPDAAGLRGFAAVLALGALVVLGPLLTGTLRSSFDQAPTLRALGMTSRDLAAVGVLRVGALAALAGAVAVVAIRGVSPLLPLGAVERLEGAVPLGPGLLPCLVGALAVAGATMLLGAVGVAASLRLHRRGRPAPRPNAVHGLISTLGLGPRTAAGARFALQPGKLHEPSPARSGVAVAALSVAAVGAVVTFGAGLTHLRETPRLYGFNWDAFTVLDDADAVATALEADPDVIGVGRGTFFPPANVSLGDDRSEVWLMSFEAGPHRPTPSVIRGRAPAADHEVLLATELGDTLGADVGDPVTMHVVAPEVLLAEALGVTWDGPTERDVELTVAGIGVLPISDGRLGIGAAMTLDGLSAAATPPSSPALLRMLRDASPQNVARVLAENTGAELTADVVATTAAEDLAELLFPPVTPQIVVIDAAGPTAAVDAAVAASEGGLGAGDLFTDPSPERLVGLDLSRAGRIPDTFRGLLAGVALVIVAMVLAIGTDQRRHELSVLRAIGFGSGDVRRSLVAQAVTTGIAASVLVPIGVIAGRYLWLAYADGLGVVPEAKLDSPALGALLGLLFAVCLGSALLTAWLGVGRDDVATRLRAGE